MSSPASITRPVATETIHLTYFKANENREFLQTIKTTVKVWEEIESEFQNLVDASMSAGTLLGVDLKGLSEKFSIAEDMAANILDYNDSEGVYHVAQIRTSIVGVAIIKDGLIDYILTAPQHRRDIGQICSRHQSSIHGIGTGLVKSMAHSRLSLSGEPLLSVESTDGAVGFFEKQGFRASDVGDLVDMNLSRQDGLRLLSR